MKTQTKLPTRRVEIEGVEVTMTVLTTNGEVALIKFDPNFGKIRGNSSPSHTLEYIVEQCIEAAIIFAEDKYILSTDVALEGKPIGNKKIEVTYEETSQ
jgi:hypothetical protein